MLAALLFALQVAPAADEAQVQADLRCMAVMALAGSQMSGEARSGLAAATTYYVGRIDARRPDFDYEAALVALFGSNEPAALLQSERARCAAEMTSRGETLQVLGRALQRRGGAAAK